MTAGLRTRAASRAAAPLAALVFLAAGCHSAEEREAERMLGALEHLRDADGPERVKQLEAVEAMSSTVPSAEKARVACSQAFRALVDTQRLVAEAKGPPIDRAKLERATEALGLAKSGHEACIVGIVELRRWLKRT